MNEQNGMYGQLDLDKLWSMVQACPELIKTFQTKDGATHHAINVNIGYNKNGADQNGNISYMQIACKAADRKYDASAYYVGNFKPSGQGGGSSNQPPMPASAPWGSAAPAPAPTPQQQQMPQQAPAPGYQQAPAPQQAPAQPQNNMPFPPPTGDPNAPF